MKKFRKYSVLVFTGTMLLLTAACKKSENFYQSLVDLPEIRKIYDNAYEVGSQMIITGRLNPDNGLKIEIGGITAKITGLTKVVGGGTQYAPYYVDQATLTITKEMGIGPNRPVKITSAGNVIDGPPIEIFSSGDLADSLQLVSYSTLPTGSLPLYGINGKGSVYLYDGPTNSIKKIAKGGTTVQVVTPASLKDTYGTFAITAFNAGGVDPQEENLYFSAVTTDASADNATNLIYRFCRYNIKTSQLTTLNRTLFLKSATKPLIPTAGLLEGNISQVNLMELTGVYPDSKDNLYLRLGNIIVSGSVKIENSYATARLTTNGELKYLYKSTVPPGIRASQQREYTASISLVPGVGMSYKQGPIMPDENRMYSLALGDGQMNGLPTRILQYDLLNQTTLYNYTKPNINFTKPYISGSFNILTAVSTGGFYNTPTLFGLMPMPGAKLMILYYQERTLQFDDKRFPAFGTMNFNEQRGDRYAPGAVKTNNYKMNEDDVMLNYDEEGMIYTTANSKTLILKTQKQ
jgi:hypothetical protein